MNNPSSYDLPVRVLLSGKGGKKSQMFYALLIILVELQGSDEAENNTSEDEYKRLERGYPSASGTWNSKNNVQSYGWDSPHPVDLCNQCVNLNKPVHHFQTWTDSSRFPQYTPTSASPPFYMGKNEYRGNGYDSSSPEWKYREMMSRKQQQQQQQQQQWGRNKWNSNEDDNQWQLVSSSEQHKYNAYERNWNVNKAYPVQVEGYSSLQQQLPDRSSSYGTNWRPDYWSSRSGIVQGWIGGKPYGKPTSYVYNNKFDNVDTGKNSYHREQQQQQQQQQFQGHFFHGKPPSADFIDTADHKYGSGHKKKPIIYYEYNLDEKKGQPVSIGGSGYSSATDLLKNCVYRCRQQSQSSPLPGNHLSKDDQSNSEYRENAYQRRQMNYIGNNYGHSPYENRRTENRNDFYPPSMYNDIGNSANFHGWAANGPVQQQQQQQQLHGFKPWDETTKGISGWDMYGKGHYFATDGEEKHIQQNDGYASDNSDYGLGVYPLRESQTSRPWNKDYVSQSNGNFDYIKNALHSAMITSIPHSTNRFENPNDQANKMLRYSGHSGIGATTEHGFPVKVTDLPNYDQRTHVRSVTVNPDSETKQYNETQSFVISVV